MLHDNWGLKPDSRAVTPDLDADDLLEVFASHSKGRVKSLARNKRMFAPCSADDHTIRIWEMAPSDMVDPTYPMIRPSTSLIHRECKPGPGNTWNRWFATLKNVGYSFGLGTTLSCRLKSSILPNCIIINAISIFS